MNDENDDVAGVTVLDVFVLNVEKDDMKVFTDVKMSKSSWMQSKMSMSNSRLKILMLSMKVMLKRCTRLTKCQMCTWMAKCHFPSARYMSMSSSRFKQMSGFDPRPEMPPMRWKR